MLKRQKPQPDLQVPVPNFPLSSPISEEIASPSCSSAEDHDEERDRPFAFLAKAARQKLEGKTKDENRSPGTSHREASRLNIRGITKKRKSVAKPVGLNLVTDFTLAPVPARKQPPTENIQVAAPFVDLNDLKLLSKVRERERSAQKSKDLFRKRISRGFHKLPVGIAQSPSQPNNTSWFLNPPDDDPFHDRHEQAISPSDRNVMIGLAVPRNESIERSREFDTAGAPPTPTIIVTPAREEAPWNAASSSTEMLRPRVTSSIYSQPTPRLWQFQSDIPPVPAIPMQHAATTKSTGSEPEYNNTGVEINARLSPASSWEDASPPVTPGREHTSIQQTRLSVNTADPDRPQSQGWWTYLLSPLLNRSAKSPLSPSFPRDSPSTPSPTTTRTRPRQWIQEKEISCFSPDTPETAAPMGEKAFEMSRSFSEDQQGVERQQSPPPAYVSNVSSRQNTMSFMFGSQAIQGEAAEYYQACAHELFSKAPYFECCNHICSITPVHPTVVPAGAVGTGNEDSSRGLALVALDSPDPSGLEASRSNESLTQAASAQSTKNAGLLIDIDSPRPETISTKISDGYAARTKEVQVDSPMSDSSSDFWNSSVVDKDERGSTIQKSRGGDEESRSQPAVAPIPVPVAPVEPSPPVPAPAPAPAAFAMPEPAPAPAPIPTPAPAPAPVPPQIITNIAPPVTNVHYTSPPQQQPLQPVVQYVPVFHQVGQPAEPSPQGQQPQPQELSRGIPPPERPPRVVSSRSEWPWGDAQPQEQTQTQKPANQGQVTGFEWAFDQPEQPQEPPVTREPQAPQTAYGQGFSVARKPVYGHVAQPQGPLVIQGRQSGSGWPFGINAHPHSNAPPVPPLTRPDSTTSQTQNQQEQRESEEPQTERGLPQESGLAPLPPQGSSQDSEPISPGFQRAAGGPGSIPMSDMQAPAPAYTQVSRDAPLPPRYDVQPRYDHNPEAGVSSVNPSGAIGPYETRRRRLEREDAAGRRFCGLWRGRGPFSKKSGRPGREGRTRRRWYFVICIFFFIIVLIATILAITLTRDGHSTPIQSRWLNLTGYPPIPTGIATLGGTQPQLEKSTCITPSSMWSCALPKEQQDDNEPYNANQPNFRVSIQFRNGTYDNSTTVGSNSTNNLRIRDDMFNPSPAAPSDVEQSFLGQYTDNNTVPYAGEGTPFYMSILSPVPLASANIYRRFINPNSTAYPNISSIIPAPDEHADGTPAAAKLYPLSSSQPIRLYNRGLPTEHYGFYTYFDKSIFLTSQTQSQPSDTNGGVSKSTAEYRCTWSQTRFLVQIWTQPDKIGRRLLPPNNTTANPTSTSTSTPTSSSSATDFSRPGSFPYPVTITLDRHGGAEKKKMLYCYPISEGRYNITGAQLQLEDRAVGGDLVNPASGLFKGIDGKHANGSVEEYGGVDGGAGGCGCQWVNWISAS
ncbi:hypothetical protein N7457_006426 [Penicillium paradoxum]|uniref:uncharacterized protein n=1 Tax=Penicillium paradoxum TaxID=176176 RepID=UPI002548711E|nr:uncharacterized protein N7457_006426 [Penicillium paradoxum]KAJ5781266.1 hypothetical protein N7457_006426 [Penicillium paradoxum]